MMFTEFVTCEKQSEHLLHQSQQMLQLIIDNLPGSVFWKDRDLVYLGCNQSFATIAGVGTPQNIIGKTDYDLAWKLEESEFFRQTDQRVMESDTAHYHIIEPQLQADGKQAWLDTNKIPLHDVDGHVIGVLGTFEDITERKQMEEALRTNETKFRSLIENIAAPIFIYQDNKMVYVNSAGTHLTGYSEHDILGMNFWDIVHPDDQEVVQQRAIARQRGEAIDTSYEIKIVTHSGAERWVNITANSLQLDGKSSIIVTGFDITERKQEEAERARTQQTIIEAQQTTLRDLATPMIPINDQVVIMPLIGQIDSFRARQIMETLLHGIARSGAQIAILDITGVPCIDTQVAAALLEAARAVQLLGARVILSGIRPDVAQTLVMLDIALTDIMTHSSLQTAVAYAIGTTPHATHR